MPFRGNWNITPHPVVGDGGPGEGITATFFFFGGGGGGGGLNLYLGELLLGYKLRIYSTYFDSI